MPFNKALFPFEVPLCRLFNAVVRNEDKHGKGEEEEEHSGEEEVEREEIEEEQGEEERQKEAQEEGTGC